jgi:adhesin transport system membrane fusion protein
VVSKIDLVRLRRERTELQGQISDVRGSIPRLRTAAGEAEQKITEYKSGYLADVSNQINEQRAELESLEKTLSAGADRVTRAQVRSPVRGTVKSINVNTIGGVIKPGEEIMEIVPLDDTLLVEAKIRPADIAFIRPEQPATVKITAYDFSIYGGLKGKVEHISADTIQDEEGDHFYRVQVRTQETALTHRGERLPIIPGMTATVEILTGQKSVLDYLMKPILRAQEQALRER